MYFRAMDFYFTQMPDRLFRSEMPMRSCAIDFSLSMFPLRIFLVLICLWAYAAQLPAQREWQASDVPIPYLRNSARYVSDPDGLLKPAERDSADYYLGRLERSKGVQSLFVVVNRVKDGDAFRMAQDLGNRLGVGDKETRRGLVVVIAVKDKRYFIAPGMGLESELTDVDCDDIAQACVVPYMREGQPGKAVWATARALYNKVSTGKTGVKSIDEDGDAGDLVFAIVLTLLFFSIPIYMLVRAILVKLGVVKPSPKTFHSRSRHDDDWFPPFIFGGGGSLGHGGGFSGGSFGGGSFGGGGAGGSW